jgi:hypothetical protein
MTPDSGSMDQAVSRAIRANLESLKRQSEDLHQAVADLVSACASSRPANALSATLRAQSTAAALGASLEVLGRFIASAGQSSRNAGDDFAPRGMETLRAVSTPAREPEPSHPEPPVPIPMSTASEPSSEVADTSSTNGDFTEVAPTNAPPTTIDGSTFNSEAQEEKFSEPVLPVQYESENGNGASPSESIEESPVEASSNDASTTDTGSFDLQSLPQDQQEMHRRANRVAKVSMQDIQLLKPDQVKQGREHRDLCIRLKDEIGKARKEYERRFQPILGHGVDYFYHWMVEVLGAGDPETLGEYPYSSQAIQQ